MKRFWSEVTVAPSGDGWQVMLDARPLRTQGGAAQIVPSLALADALADEWRAQGDTVDPRRFPLRDLADLAIDQAGPARADAIDKLLRYAETDTLCYRADPDEPLYRRQQDLWEPLVARFEQQFDVRMERVSGIVHRPQAPATLAALRGRLEQHGPYALAALLTLASLAASLVTALLAIEPGADADALFAAANAEEDWQAELWSWDAEAARDRAIRLAAFSAAVRFAELARMT